MNKNVSVWKLVNLVILVENFTKIVFEDQRWLVKAVGWIRNDFKFSANVAIFEWQRKVFSYPALVPKLCQFERKI